MIKSFCASLPDKFKGYGQKDVVASSVSQTFDAPDSNSTAAPFEKNISNSSEPEIFQEKGYLQGGAGYEDSSSQLIISTASLAGIALLTLFAMKRAAGSSCSVKNKIEEGGCVTDMPFSGDNKLPEHLKMS
jgi:hypothetical protein